MSQHLIHLNSKDFILGSNNNQPKVKIDNNIFFKDEVKCKISNFNIPNSFQQINDVLQNNTFSFEEDDLNDPIQITIQNGWYTFVTIVNELTSKINASTLSSVVTVSYNQINSQLIFTSDGVTDIKFNLLGNPGFASLIGFDPVDGVFANSQTSVRGINLLPRRTIYVQSPEIMSVFGIANSFQTTSISESSIVFAVDVSGLSQDVSILRENISDKFQQIINKNKSFPKIITMQCVDDFGNLIDFMGQPFSIELQLTFP